MHLWRMSIHHNSRPPRPVLWTSPTIATAMRILFLAHRIPYPPNKGDKIRSYHMLQYLTERHDVYLGTLVDDKNDLVHIDALGRRVRGIVFRTFHPSLKKIAALVSLARTRPLSVAYFYCRRLQRDIDEWILQHEFDVVLCFSSPMAEYVLRSPHREARLKRSVLLMDLIDVDSYKWHQYAQLAKGWRKWIYRYEAAHLAEYERLIAKEFDHLLVVSAQEKQIFFDHVAEADITAVTNGVDLRFFSPVTKGSDSDQRPTLVFTGVMDYWPNVEGVTWFAEDIFPKIKAAVPEVVFYVVGSRPTAAVQKLGQIPGIRVTGFVEDVRDYLSIATVCVVPLRIARGIQNKVLEAMAMGRAVVSTRDAIEGIRARQRPSACG